MQWLKNASPILPILFLATAVGCNTMRDKASTVKDGPAAAPDAEILAGFKANCLGCHANFKKQPGNQVKWEAIVAASSQVISRLSWESINPDAVMPPPDTEENAAIAVDPALRAKMIAAVKAAAPVPGANLPLARLHLPSGFKATVFAEIPGARSITTSPSGTVYVGTGNDAGEFKAVYAIRDVDGDGIGESVYKIAEGLASPNGVAFKDGALYVGEIKRVLKFKNVEADLAHPPAAVALPATFPSDTHHGRKFIAFGPDGKLYVPVGSPCNICEPSAKHGKIFRMNTDGTDVQLFAKGVRNTVGFAWHPDTKELWFTDNGRDLLGDGEPPDELNRAPTAGLDFGFPRCHSSTPDPQFGGTQGCTGVTAPTQKLQPHTAALGMRFYTGAMFPEAFRKSVIIAEHGSWNSTNPVGYRLSRVTLNGNAATSYSTFIDGWLNADGSRWGRPVDVEVWKDGSLLVTDDYAGVVYRIAYVAP